MNDCSNADIRDQLPALFHEFLTADERDTVLAHLAECNDCRDELELLRCIHRVLHSHTPTIDVSQIVAALPRPSLSQPTGLPTAVTGDSSDIAPVGRPARRGSRRDWRIAAAVTLLAVGGSSVSLINRTSAGNGLTDSTASTLSAAGGSAEPVTSASSQAARIAQVAAGSRSSGFAETSSIAARSAAAKTVATSSATPSGERIADVEAAADINPGGRMANLSEAQLSALLGDINRMPAVPVTEPAPVTIRVSGPTVDLPQEV